MLIISGFLTLYFDDTQIGTKSFETNLSAIGRNHYSKQKNGQAQLLVIMNSHTRTSTFLSSFYLSLKHQALIIRWHQVIVYQFKMTLIGQQFNRFKVSNRTAYFCICVGS